MTGLGWAWQVAVPGVGESSPGPIPQQEESTDHALYIQNGRGLGREGQAVQLILSAPTGASTGLLGRGGVGRELSVPGPAGMLRAGQRSARPHPAPHRGLRPGEPRLTGFCPLSRGMPCASQRAEEEARTILRQRTESQLSRSTNGPQPPPPPAQPTNCTNSSFKEPERQEEAGRGPMSPGGWAVGLLLHAASPAPKPQPTAFHQRGPPPRPWATSTPPPSCLLGACVLGETPNSKLLFPDPGSHSWTGRVGGR